MYYPGTQYTYLGHYSEMYRPEMRCTVRCTGLYSEMSIIEACKMKYIYIITALKLHRTSGIVEASIPVVGLKFVSCPCVSVPVLLQFLMLDSRVNCQLYRIREREGQYGSN